MLLIPCPNCGLRDETEFHYGGPCDLSRPDPNAVSDADWAEFLYCRDNPLGAHRERWLHRFGCGCWFGLERDTTSHQIIQAFSLFSGTSHSPAGDR